MVGQGPSVLGKKFIVLLVIYRYFIVLFDFGPLAHPVERSHGMGEVIGSSPIWSTGFTFYSSF